MPTPSYFSVPGAVITPPNFISTGSSALGVDISALNDLDPNFGLCSGFACLGQDLLHRLSTGNGTMINDPDYGFDLLQMLNATLTQAQLNAFQPAITREVEKDQRVQSAAVSVSFNSDTNALAVTLRVMTANGPFTYVIGVSSLTIQLLSSSASN